MKILRIIVYIVFIISVYAGFFEVVHAQTNPQPPSSLTQPPTCSDDGWSATFQWEKSPTAEVNDYVLRVDYSDFPTPLWLVSDGTDIWKRHKGSPETTTTAAMIKNIFPDNEYAGWTVQSVIGDDTVANDARMAKSTQSFFCTPKRTVNPECTIVDTPCEPSIETWIKELKYINPYHSQDLNADTKIDLVDFEKIRELKYMPTNIPTPLPQVQINVKNQQGQPVAVSMYRLQCITDSGQCSSDFLQSQGINSCRHDSRNMSTSTLTVDIQSNTCKAGAGIEYNPSEHVIIGITGVPDGSQNSTYTSTSRSEQNIVWDTWTTGTRTIDIIIDTLTP